MNKQVLVSIFCYNVEEFIYNVLEKFYKSNSKDISIILINDYSTDKTLYEVKKFINKFNTKNIEIINNSKNMGYGYNYKISFDYAIRNDFTKIIFLHGDGQYPPSQIKQMSNLLEENSLVCGSRFLNFFSVRENMPNNRFFANRILTIFINFLFRKKFTEYFSGFRGYSIIDIKKIDFEKLSNHWIFEQQLQFVLMKKNMKIAEFSIETIYENQVSNLPPIKYCIEVVFNAIKFAFFKKN
tara:strand:+ start:12968 stop:13687 length:720 start_codon:yes stop_codon:yes gene_type:complete